MAWDDELQKTEGILGDIGGVVEQGLGIFSQVKETLYPASSLTQPVSQQAPTTAKPEVQAAASPLANIDGKTIAVIAVIGFLILSARK